MRLQLGRITFRISIAAGVFTRSRTVFLLAMAILAAARILLSAFLPATYDLRDMVSVLPPTPPLGPWMALEMKILETWQSITSQTITPQNWAMAAPPDMSANMRFLSLMLRLPSFVFDVGIAIMLYFALASLASSKTARLASLLWFLNPYTVFTGELLGVPDIATAFLTLCVAVCLLKGRGKLASVFFAVSVALKLYPILLLPALLIYVNRKMVARATTRLVMLAGGVIGLAGYVSWAYPGWVANLFLFEYTPVTQTLSLYIPYQPTVVRVSAATVFLVLVYFAMWRFAESPNLTDYILPVLLVYFTFSFLYPQYLIWAIPFLTLDVVLVKCRRVLMLGLLLSIVFLNWFFESGGLPTPSGYSMLLFPLSGKTVPWFSQYVISFLKAGAVGVLIFPIVEAAVYAMTLIYALEIMRGWFYSQPYGKSV